MIYKTLHRKIKIEQHEHHTKHGNGLRGSGSALVTPGCYSCYIFGHKSRRKKGSDCDYDKRNISVFICDVSQMLNTFFVYRHLFLIIYFILLYGFCIQLSIYLLYDLYQARKLSGHVFVC